MEIYLTIINIRNDVFLLGEIEITLIIIFGYLMKHLTTNSRENSWIYCFFVKVSLVIK